MPSNRPRTHQSRADSRQTKERGYHHNDLSKRRYDENDDGNHEENYEENDDDGGYEDWDYEDGGFEEGDHEDGDYKGRDHEYRDPYDRSDFQEGVDSTIRPSRCAAYQGPAAGVSINHKLWPANKQFLRVRFLNGNEWERKTVMHLVKKYYNSIPMHLQFMFLCHGALGPSDIRVTFANISQSFIGREAEAFPKKTTLWLNLYPVWHKSDASLKRQADVLHEFGHALGMEHEQQHPGCPADWNHRVLQARHGWDRADIEHAYERVDALRARFSQYDPESIMHYPVQPGDAFSSAQEIPLNVVPSNGDVEFLVAVYPEQSAVSSRSKKHRPKYA